MNKFNKLYNTIMESFEDYDDIESKEVVETDIKPTCIYCNKPVSMEKYYKEKANHDRQNPGYEFKPDQCVCDKCAAELMKEYEFKSNYRRRALGR